MKTLTRLSKKAEIFCDLSGLDADKVKEAMNSSGFAFLRCETKMEMEYEGVDYAYPYVIYNPYNIELSYN
mgnify:CR=1 FL=1